MTYADYTLNVVRPDGSVAGTLNLGDYPGIRRADGQADLDNLAIDLEFIVLYDTAGGTE